MIIHLLTIEAFTFKNFKLFPARLYSVSADVKGINIKGCKFSISPSMTGSPAISVYLNSESGRKIDGVSITKCTFTNYQSTKNSRQIMLTGANNSNIKIASNVFNMNTLTDNQCIYFDNLSANNIDVVANQFYDYKSALYILSGTYNGVNIFNNFMESKNVSFGVGIVTGEFVKTNFKIYNNTIQTNANCIAGYFDNVELVNNILESSNSVAVYNYSTGFFARSDYNVYFGPALVYWNSISYSIVTDYKAVPHSLAGDNDAHSMSTQPYLGMMGKPYEPYNNSLVIDNGLVLTEVTKDIEGRPRDKYTPTIGCYEAYGKIHGDFTIGGVDGDFDSFSSVFSVLNTMGTTVDGPLNFSVRAQIFNEKLSLNNIFSTFPKNTITFTGVDTSKTIINFAHSSDGANLAMYNVSHVTFKNIGFKVQGAYGHAVILDNGCDSINFESCHFYGRDAGANSTQSYIYSDQYAYNLKYISFKDCNFSKSAYGMLFESTSTVGYRYRLSIENSIFNLQDSGALKIDGFDTLLIKGNTMKASNDLQYLFVNRLDYCKRLEFLNNIVYSEFGGNALYLQNADTALIANNCFTIGASTNTSAGIGIYAYNPSELKIYNNTIANYVLQHLGTLGAGINIDMNGNVTDFVRLKNNIVSSCGNEALAVSGDYFSNVVGKNNDFHSVAGQNIALSLNGTYNVSLPNLQSSYFYNPILTKDLIPSPLSCMNIVGEPMGDTVKYDINGKLRGTKPKLGAVENNNNVTFNGGTYTIGSKGYFKTIKEAFSRLSSCGITGPIVLSLTDNVYNEDSMYVQHIAGLSAINTITLKPAPSVVSTVNFATDESNGTPFRFRDIRYLTIDGASNGPDSHNLKFVANDIAQTSSATLLDFFPDTGNISNIIITNCEFVSTRYADANMAAINFGANQGSSSNIVIKNNIIRKANIGIRIAYEGVTSQNIKIQNNDFGEAITANSISNKAISINMAKFVEISGNKIQNIINNYEALGIELTNAVDPKIFNNVISNIIGDGGEIAAATGIYLTLHENTQSALVADNVINHLGGYIGATGLLVEFNGTTFASLPSGGVKILNNTISLNKDSFIALGSSGAQVNGVRLFSSSYLQKKVTFLNNIVSVKLGDRAFYTSGTSGNGLRIPYKSLFTESNYNLIEVSGNDANYTVAIDSFSTNLASISAWRTYSGFDVNSTSAAPNFVNDSLWVIAYNSPCINAGKPSFTDLAIAGINKDVRGRARIINGTIDMGAVEFEALQITSQSTNQTICQGVNGTLVIATNYPEIATYKWQVSSNNVTWADSSAAKNDTLIVLKQNYYRCIASAPGYVNDTSNVMQVVVKPSPVIETASGETICMGQEATITAKASIGSVMWYNEAIGGTLLVQSSSYTTPKLATTTTYYVQASYNGCYSVSRTAVTVTVSNYPAVEFKAIATNVTALNSGTIKIATSTGTAPFSYSIDGGANYTSTNLFTGLAAQTYQVTVRDLYSCVTKQSVTINNCVADFTFTATESTLKLNNLSVGASQFYWTYGDGAVSNDSSPSYKYATPGQYEVCMTMVNMAANCMANKCKLIKIDSLNTSYLAAKYNYTVSQLQVSFTNISEKATNYYWIFGDGQFSTETSPAHTYTRAGIYVVYLKAYNSSTGKSATYMRKIVVGTPVCSNEASFRYVADNAGKVVFTNTSIGKNAYYWTFDDGMSSTLANPVHNYKNAGYYLVSLTVKDSVGTCSDAYSQLVKIGDIACKADFDYSVETSTNTVTLKNLSTGNIANTFWLFDGRNYSTLQNPTFRFPLAGIHNISLTVLDEKGTCIDYIEKSVQVGKASCNADFSYYVDSLNNKVEFTCLDNTGGTNLYWIFGDGSISTETNPAHIFKRAGYYQVSLTTLNPETGCMDNVSKIILVASSDKDCEADFIYSLGTDNQTVAFKNKSKGDIVKWLWNFGDNSAISNETSPTHLYNVQDDYNVCLTVVDANNIVNITCKSIKVGSSLGNENVAEFAYVVSKDSAYARFYNLSSGTYNKVEWNFGDGKTSAIASPQHKYSNSGYYLVSLKVINTANNSHNITYKLLNVNKPDTFLVRFAYLTKPYSKKAGGYPVDFIGAGLGDQAKLKWDFGDGETDSTTTSPEHTYTNSDDYEVCLTYADPITGDSSTYCEKVTTATLCQSDEVNPEPLCKNIDVHLDATGKAVVTANMVDNGSNDACGVKSISLSETTFNTTGNKPVTLTVTDNSGNKSTCPATVSVLSYVGVETAENQLGLNVYPNPFTDKLVVKMDIPDYGVVNLSIVDVSGRNVRLKKQMTLEKGERFITLDGDMLEQGTYYLRATDSKGRMKQTVIVKQ